MKLDPLVVFEVIEERVCALRVLEVIPRRGVILEQRERLAERGVRIFQRPYAMRTRGLLEREDRSERVTE
jgi:hypothetical protein